MTEQNVLFGATKESATRDRRAGAPEMFVFFVILSVLVTVIVAIAVGAAISWISADLHQGSADPDLPSERYTFIDQLFRWFSNPTKKIDYRRDKLGRFRKVRRG